MRKKIRNFLQQESASGLILMAAAFAALILANSPFYHMYEQVTSCCLFVINEGLMALFFLLIGLELKRGFLEDKFSSASNLLLPLAAAAGGMIVPALIYLFFNGQHAELARGWATPVATDIAFALGVLSLFGRRVPKALKFFLMAIAIYDDIGAILIIAFFYSHDLAPVYLFYAGIVIATLLFFNAFKIRGLTVYLLGGVLLWMVFLKAGIHPTLAGVITALLIPEIPYKGVTPVHYLEEKLHPWVSYLIMPLFAFANAGLSFQHVTGGMVFDSVVVGIVLGLFVGKQLGVLGVSWLSIRTTRWAMLPAHSTWLELYGVALLCGIGFTMSLFLGTLSFQGQTQYINEVRLGVLAGSILSGLAGAIILKLAFRNKKSS
jgi:NhaA family Na+:H+ antiporter